MTFYQPQLTLLLNNAGDYILHSTTYFPSLNFLAQGHGSLLGSNAEMELTIELYVEDISLPDTIDYINPIVHTVNLGNPFGADGIEAVDGSVRATVYVIDSNNLQFKQVVETSVVKNPSTSMDSKPIPK